MCGIKVKKAIASNALPLRSSPHWNPKRSTATITSDLRIGTSIIKRIQTLLYKINSLAFDMRLHYTPIPSIHVLQKPKAVVFSLMRHYRLHNTESFDAQQALGNYNAPWPEKDSTSRVQTHCRIREDAEKRWKAFDWLNRALPSRQPRQLGTELAGRIRQMREGTILALHWSFFLISVFLKLYLPALFSQKLLPQTH